MNPPTASWPGRYAGSAVLPRGCLIYSAYSAPWGRQVDPESAYAMNGLVGWSASERRECDMLVGIRREFGLGPLRRMIKHILRKICGEYDDLWGRIVYPGLSQSTQPVALI